MAEATRRRKSQPRQPVRRAERVDVDTSVPCATEGCEGKVQLSVTGETYPALARMIREQASGEREAWCDPCVDRLARKNDEAEAEARAQHLFAERLRRSRVPPKWSRQTFDELDVDRDRREAVDAAAAWGERSGAIGLLLYGPVGRGKTAIAAAAAMRRLHHAPVRWLNVADLLMALRMPFDSPEYARAQRVLDAGATSGRGLAVTPPALVLDDLDKTKPSEHALQPLYAAVNRWVEAELPLFVTLNRDLDDLSRWFGEAFGQAIASRLAGHCEVHRVGGRDRRLD